MKTRYASQVKKTPQAPSPKTQPKTTSIQKIQTPRPKAPEPLVVIKSKVPNKKK